MNTSMEVQVLQWFERVLAQPAAARADWLAAQEMPDAMRERVQRLLDAESAASGFMEATAVQPETPPPEFPKVGDRLGNYELLKALEAGGMGVVYLGRRADDVYDQQVAIKLVRPVHLLAAAEFRRQLISRFEDERSILARMSHPNVARILDGGSTAGGIPYLVMEFVDGVSLTDYCRQNKLDVPARLKLFCKVCDGVQEAHRHLIVHRDLKPDNILVGSNGEPRLLDFGIAKILEQEPLPADGKRQTSLSAMTPAYASPEQVRQQALTTSSDVYSLGVMLYQLLAGVRPYELGGLRPSEAEHVVCDTLPDPMHRMLAKAVLSDAERRQRRAQITPDVERIVAKAMHKEAARRYGSAQELADDIQRYLAGQPVLAHPDSTLYRLGKFVRRHRLGVAAASVALAAVLAATGVALWQAERARQAARDTEQVNNFLMDVLKSSDPFDAGAEISLSEAVDRASAKVPERFAGRPDLSSRVHMALGYSMVSRYKLDLAERELGLALAQSTQAHGADSMPTLRIREAVAQLRSYQGRDDEAVAGWQSVVAGMEALGAQGDKLYAIALNNLGNHYLAIEEYAKADEVLKRAAALPPPADPSTLSPTDPILLVGNQAFVAHGLGDLERAKTLYEQAQAELEKLVPEGSPELASVMNNHAMLLQDLGEKEAAYALSQRSIAMREKIFRGDHPMLVAPVSGLAMWAVGLKKYDEAVALAEKAAKMSERVYAESNHSTAFAWWTLSLAQTKTGDFAAAGESLQRSEREFAKLDPPPEDLAESIPALREHLCDQAKAQGAAVAICAR
ncbi:serine/threonine-protein kinase [Arenimonas terrae]|uniref:Serine/threonine protein kinase n=1 Tax=Arenimonas terrae TaxID=2546226 RepID=A0A5C4RP11_9GAMM|nr:serine/threonine-protein kinase [Arenimonas terrae]TNJ32852.1 serine/threonine protein kinase [Arenimonas terrae]